MQGEDVVLAQGRRFEPEEGVGDDREQGDDRSFASALRGGREEGRDGLVLSQAAWTCQRSVRWGDWIGIRTYHDGYHEFPEWMLFDVENDPHETNDVATENPRVIEQKLNTFIPPKLRAGSQEAA